MLLIGVKHMCEAPFLRLAGAKCRQSKRLYSEQCLGILVTRSLWKENNRIPPMCSAVRGAKPSAAFLNILLSRSEKVKHYNSCEWDTAFAPQKMGFTNTKPRLASLSGWCVQSQKWLVEMIYIHHMYEMLFISLINVREQLHRCASHFMFNS